MKYARYSFNVNYFYYGVVGTEFLGYRSWVCI